MTHNVGILAVASVVTWLVYNLLFQVVWGKYTDRKMQGIVQAALSTERDALLASRRVRAPRWGPRLRTPHTAVEAVVHMH